MISRRDQLLIRPWQQRRYENHRKKVLTAVPAIDNRPPASRNHVSVKLKKHQKEIERCQKIEKDNFSLLRNLCYIMKTNRVDNSWEKPLPSFLNRVALFQSKLKEKQESFNEIILPKSASRREKCVACTPKKPSQIKIPEERIPWEPEKQPLSKRIRSQSVPVRRNSVLPVITESEIKERSKSCKSRLSSIQSGIEKVSKNKAQRFDKAEIQSPQSITLSRGCLKLAVNFPSDTMVKLQDGNNEKLLLGGDCFCRTMSKVY